MRFSDILTASVVAPLVVAHGGVSGAPKIIGLPRDLKERAPIVARTPRYSTTPTRTVLEARQDPSWPSGVSTRNDPRPQKGNVAYGGSGVVTCIKPGTVALTYDDGPGIYTNGVLDQFAKYGYKATFFINGNNGGQGDIENNPTYVNVIKRMVAEGHQVGSHTWTHADLSVISEEDRYNEMVKNEMVIRNIIGKYPTYMRPPYTSCNEDCQRVMKDLGYVISYYDIETDDWRYQDNIQPAKDNFKNALDATPGGSATGHRISLEHDIHELSATELTPYMLEYLKSQGYKGVTLGECLGEPEENWYRTPSGVN